MSAMTRGHFIPESGLRRSVDVVLGLRCFKNGLKVRTAYLLARSCANPEGGVPDTTPLENLKATAFLSNIGPDPLFNHEATKPAFNVVPLSARQRKTI